MSRLAHLARSPRRTLAALATVLTAVGITYASGADFTAQSANPANTFSAGTLSMFNSASNSAVLTASNLKPGGTPVDSDTTNPLSAKLNTTVTDCGAYAGATAPTCGDGDDTTVYTGTLAQMGTAGHAIAGLGSFGAAAKHRYQFSVGLDSTADNNNQGDSSTATFTWNAA
jgi:hypothetical protein